MHVLFIWPQRVSVAALVISKLGDREQDLELWCDAGLLP